MIQQCTDTVFMIRPASFGFNEETASNNFFQQRNTIQVNFAERAVEEFNSMVYQLRSHQLKVIVADDTPVPAKPDAIFPNNWFTAGHDGMITLFPLWARNRRAEKRDEVIDLLKNQFKINGVLDLGEFEAENRFLEGTGSMVMDHANRMIYACLSERTHPLVLEKYAAFTGYRAIVFNATDAAGQVVYHTNVMMSIGSALAIVCLEAIEDEYERIAVAQLLRTGGHRVIEITREQMHCFAANVLELRSSENKSILVLSETAMDSLSDLQKDKLRNQLQLLPVAIPTIERIGGGGVRCLMTEIFLPVV